MAEPEMIKEEPGGTGYSGSFRSKLPVTVSIEDTGNRTINVLALDGGHPQREFLFSNDSTADASIWITGVSTGVDVVFTVKANEVLDERLAEFDSVVITATGAWRLLLRSGRIAK